MRRVAIAVLCALAVSSSTAGQTTPADQQIYETFRAWVTQLPPRTQGQPDVLTQYREVLRDKGLTPQEIDRQMTIIDTQGQRLEIERWNQILTNPNPTFNTEPNAFLVQIAKNRTPGTALDVGMGQGRNAIYLAQHGWQVTGFDPAERAVAAAQEQARKLGIQLETHVADDEHFDWGRDRWDMIVLSYVGAREYTERVINSLRPGGVVVVEAFHRDATKNASIGGGVVFDNNELLRLFDKFRVIHYEDAEATGDFGGRRTTRVVRLAAERVR
jgi:SAM-dependent methyltransferase